MRRAGIQAAPTHACCPRTRCGVMRRACSVQGHVRPVAAGDTGPGHRCLSVSSDPPRRVGEVPWAAGGRLGDSEPCTGSSPLGRDFKASVLLVRTPVCVSDGGWFFHLLRKLIHGPVEKAGLGSGLESAVIHRYGTGDRRHDGGKRPDGRTPKPSVALVTAHLDARVEGRHFLSACVGQTLNRMAS